MTPISARSIGGLLFDFGGVLAEIDFNCIFSIWASYANIDPDTIKSKFSFDSFYEQHERGEIEAPAFFESLRHSLELNLTDEQFIEGWNSLFLEEFDNCKIEIIRSKVPADD